jgi:hypothetical protein
MLKNSTYIDLGNGLFGQEHDGLARIFITAGGHPNDKDILDFQVDPDKLVELVTLVATARDKKAADIEAKKHASIAEKFEADIAIGEDAPEEDATEKKPKKKPTKKTTKAKA